VLAGAALDFDAIIWREILEFRAVERSHRRSPLFAIRSQIRSKYWGIPPGARLPPNFHHDHGR
jgi:hypothetical protein